MFFIGWKLLLSQSTLQKLITRTKKPTECRLVHSMLAHLLTGWEFLTRVLFLKSLMLTMHSYMDLNPKKSNKGASPKLPTRVLFLKSLVLTMLTIHTWIWTPELLYVSQNHLLVSYSQGILLVLSMCHAAKHNFYHTYRKCFYCNLLHWFPLLILLFCGCIIPLCLYNKSIHFLSSK